MKSEGSIILLIILITTFTTLTLTACWKMSSYAYDIMRERERYYQRMYSVEILSHVALKGISFDINIPESLHIKPLDDKELPHGQVTVYPQTSKTFLMTTKLIERDVTVMTMKCIVSKNNEKNKNTSLVISHVTIG